MSDCDESSLELLVRGECPMESLGETDIAMLEDSDERFLLDSIRNAFTWIFGRRLCDTTCGTINT